MRNIIIVLVISICSLMRCGKTINESPTVYEKSNSDCVLLKAKKKTGDS